MSPADLVQAVAGSPVVLALGWTLVHFLWQGYALGLLFALVYRAARGAGPAVRYWLGMAALGAMLLAAVATFGLVYAPTTGADGATGAAAGAAVGWSGGQLAGWHALLEPAIPWAVVLWVLGLAAHARGLAGEFRALRHVTANARPLPSPWPETVDRLRRQLGIRRCVRVLESVRVGVPIVVGWLRPVIVVPPSAILGLTPRQLELIISHELAHVARLDCLFNLAQIAVETLFFFHPAVRFVSSRVRFEREHCCDDAVVARSGETLAYARALAEIEGLRCSSRLRPAAAATGGHLRGRIARLVALPSGRRGAGRWLAGVAVLGAFAVAVFGGTRFAARNVETLVTAPETSAAGGAPAAAVTWPPPPDAGRASTSDRATLLPEYVLPTSSAAARVVPESVVARPVAPEPFTATTSAVSAGAVLASAQESAVAAETNPPLQASTASAIRPAQAAVPAAGDSAGSQRARLAAGPAAAPQPVAASAGAPGSAAAGTPVLATGASGDLTRQAEDVEPDGTAAAEAAAAATAAVPSAPPPPAVSGSADSPPRAPSVAAAAADGAPPPAPPAADESMLGRITGGELIRSPNPGYPRRARLRGVEGQVTVRYGVDLRGRIDGVEVLSADPGETFVAAVRKAVRRWRHEPFLADGEPIAARVTRTFEFAIRKEPLAAGEKPGDGCRRVTGSRLCRSQDAYQELGIVVVHNPL
jgi:TonB family protein